MCSYLVDEQPLENRPNSHVLLAPQWNLNSLLWIRLVRSGMASEFLRGYSILAQICWTNLHILRLSISNRQGRERYVQREVSSYTT